MTNNPRILSDVRGHVLQIFLKEIKLKKGILIFIREYILEYLLFLNLF